MRNAILVKARQAACNVELIVAGGFFVIMLGVVVVNVFLRYLFQTSVLFTEELAYIGFTWSTFLAIAWLYRTRALISVDVLFELFPIRLQRALALLVDASLVGANLWLAWLSWTLAQGGFIRRTPVLEVPYFWLNLAPLVAFVLMAIYSAYHLICDSRSRCAKTSQDEASFYSGPSV
ncbi:TRAP transporter small permease [Vreelandella neptunia]|uniref:TRAP transporter small permease protein n=1 Tax=Vreelandella neptunia TaxID=115551 RepID=A0ABS9S357_9GAMM|nr:TRAP transporter small permease [Halomonas neptunia]MCH4810555.1 TRAP transporter small permease [Halomonas neptunia]